MHKQQAGKENPCCPTMGCLSGTRPGIWTQVWLRDLGVSSQKCPNLIGVGVGRVLAI